MREEERIQNGWLFDPADAELVRLKERAHNLNRVYNSLADSDEARQECLEKLLGKIGKNCLLQGPVYFHYGIHTQIGDSFFASFNFTVQDDAAVTIGNNCDFGPNVTIVTPVHPMLPQERRAMRKPNGDVRQLCYALPVRIGNDCWICANTVVCSGVTIGDGCVIGAGRVVVHDIPAHSFAAGNPCRVIRPITQEETLANKKEIFAGCSLL